MIQIATLKKKGIIKMKIKSVSESFTPGVLCGFGLGAIGLFLAVFAFVAFPSSTALAVPSTCDPVEFTEVSGDDYGELYVQMSTSSPYCVIYYTVNAYNWPPNPTHSSAIYNPTGDPNYEGLGVPYGQRRYYKAFAHINSGYPTEDSIITSYIADNSGL